MIHHFPNFVCWKEIYNSYKDVRDLIYIDSTLCFLLGILFGKRGHFFPGTKMAYFLFNEPPEQQYFLLANNIKIINENKKLILPYKSSFEEDAELLNFIGKLPYESTLIIGVSSPKQNMLAIYLHSIRPDLRYFCLGAAVGITWSNKWFNFNLRGSGFQWVEFLVKQPKRTIIKIYHSTIAAFLVMSATKDIALFREFINVSKHSK